MEKAVKEGSACLVIVAQDASENTKKKMKNMTDYYEVPLYFYSDKEKLGRQIGRNTVRWRQSPIRFCGFHGKAAEIIFHN